MPDEWLISIVCEEFKCLPKQAMKALDEDEGSLIFKILDFRAYAKAKEIYDNTAADKRPNTPLMRKVSEIAMTLAQEKIDKFKREQEEKANG